MKNIRKTKSLHHIVIENCSLATRLEYNPSTKHVGIFTSMRTQRREYMQQYHVDNKKILSERGRQYYINNRDNVLRRVKQYREYHPEKIISCRKQCYINNRDNVLRRVKQYREDHPEKIAAYKKQYASKNRKHIAMYKKCYREDNIEKITNYHQQYKRDHPTDARPYVTNAGSCNHLNKWFDGCRRHHVDSNTIIHIPTEMHITHKHDIRTGAGMGEINALAFGFLFQGEL